MRCLFLTTRVVLVSSFLCVISLSSLADQQIQDDLVVVGSGCFGFDCVNGENFGFDTLRLKENNVRIKFQDTSASSSFPSTDWQLTANDSSNGGANKFSLEEIDSNTVPITILGGAPSHSIYVASQGNVGFGTNTPLVDVHAKSGNSPALRLEQDGSSGFTSQAWDIGGNETNFFIRDVTNSSKIPFKIVPNAPNNSLFIAADGDVGFETSTPDGQFDVAHSSNANNHAFLIGTNSYVGVNIDNGFVPNGLFDVQTTGGVSQLTVASDGDVSIGASGVPTASLHVERSDFAKLFVQNTSASSGPKDMLHLATNGNPQLVLENTKNNTWRLSGGANLVVKNDADETPFMLSPEGNLVLTGSITTVGGSCTSGCDMTFVESDKRVKSIEEHAKLMWQNSHLPAVGPTVENQPINLSEKTGGILHEVEVAHIYIEQLHKRLSEKESLLKQVMQRLEALEKDTAH